MIGAIINTDAAAVANIVGQFISSVGFPIFACVMMFKQNEKLESRHEEESKSFISAINNNTIAIEKLMAKIGE